MTSTGRRTAVAVLAVLPLLPVLVIARAVSFHVPRLQDYAGVILGLGATLCLLGCLAVTPVSWLTRFPAAGGVAALARGVRVHHRCRRAGRHDDRHEDAG